MLARNSISEGVRGLAPFLELGPDLSERAESRAAANPHGDSGFERVGIVRGRADVLHALEKPLETLAIVAQHGT